MNPEENKNNIEKNKPQERVPIKSLRTFQGDVQEAIEKNKYSSTTIFVSEQKRKLENPVDEKTVERAKIRNKTFVVFGAVFILLGVASVGALYYLKSNEKVAIEQKTKALIAYSEERKIDLKNLDRIELNNTVSENKKSWNASVNSVLFLNLSTNNKNIDTQNALSIIGPNMPSSLVRSFGEKYMLGVYSFDTNENFIILTVDDFSLAYSGMLKWENDLPSDLSSFFDITINASSTPKQFTDLSIKNKDIRILKDSSGLPIILYSFVDRNTLVITKNENILSAIIGKLIISKQTK